MEGHLLCNGAFRCSLSHFHALTHTHTHFREANAGTTWRTILFLLWCNGGTVTDGMGRNGREIKRRYGAMWTGPKREKWGVRDRAGGRAGSGSHIWQVKLAVIYSAEWPYLCWVVCLHVASVVLWEAAGRRYYRADRKRRPIIHLSWGEPEPWIDSWDAVFKVQLFKLEKVLWGTQLHLGVCFTWKYCPMFFKFDIWNQYVNN